MGYEPITAWFPGADDCSPMQLITYYDPDYYYGGDPTKPLPRGVYRATAANQWGYMFDERNVITGLVRSINWTWGQAVQSEPGFEVSYTTFHHGQVVNWAGETVPQPFVEPIDAAHAAGELVTIQPIIGDNLGGAIAVPLPFTPPERVLTPQPVIDDLIVSPVPGTGAAVVPIGTIPVRTMTPQQVTIPPVTDKPNLVSASVVPEKKASGIWIIAALGVGLLLLGKKK